jgi:pimeloyl-ACP methyl ester carboxylesterase
VFEPHPPSRVPTTFVWGRQDPTISRASAELAREHVEAPYRFVELGGGHWLPYTHPVEVASVLLDRVRTATAPRPS